MKHSNKQSSQSGDSKLTGRANKISADQEVELLENAFSLSSAIEILTTPVPIRDSIRQEEPNPFIDVIHFVNKLQAANEYLSHEKSHLMLQPEGTDLIATIRKGKESEISQSIEDALEILKQIVRAEKPILDDDVQIQELVSFLRTILLGVKVRLAAVDESEASLWNG